MVQTARDMKTRMNSQLKAIEANIEQVIIGKREVIHLAMITLLAKGHLLIEDVPGVGKTTLAFALARCFDSSFRRIQFTSDLLPSDILGVNIYSSRDENFEFHEGPIFSNFVLADEINRTTPKTQSCLLEAMNTGKVTIDKKTYPLPQPFLVLATQNPIEFHGTYPLPNSQMDRFLMRIRMGYPEAKSEIEILRRGLTPLSVEDLKPVVGDGDILRLQQEVPKVRMEDSLREYIVKIVERSRQHREIELGVSTRGALALQSAAQANAFLKGRGYVIPDDIKELATSVLAHRILTSNPQEGFSLDGHRSEQLIKEILESVEVPL